MAACSTGDGGGDESALAESDVPFESYLVGELDVVEDAIAILKDRCMEERGYPQFDGAAHLDDEPLEIHRTAADFGPDSESEARRYGYGRPLLAQSASAPPPVLSNDASFDEAQATCEEESYDHLGEGLRDDLSAYHMLGNDLRGGFTAGLAEHDEVRAVYRELLDCLEADGYRVDDREAYLASRSARHFGVPLGSDRSDGREVTAEDMATTTTIPEGEVVVADSQERPSAPTYEPTPEEVQLALADVRCRESIGFADRVNAAIVDIEAEVVAEHEAELLELNPRIEAAASQAADITGDVATTSTAP